MQARSAEDTTVCRRSGPRGRRVRTLDVGVVSIDAEPELQVISSLPVFLLYDSGSLREVVRVTREQRPGRLLARAIKATFDRQG